MSQIRGRPKLGDFTLLGTYLGLDESEIEVIERDHHDTARRRLVMLSKWIEKDVDTSWEKLIGSLESMSQIRLANQLKEKYCCTSESNPPATAAGPKPAECSPEKELLVDRQEFLEMETLGDDYLQLVMGAESAVEESDPPLKKLKRFSQCFMSKEILTVDELFDQMKPFYFLEYIMLEKIVKFFLPQAHSVADNLRDYLQYLTKFKSSTTVQHFMESIEQAQQSHSTTSERPGLCTVKLCLVGGWLTKTMNDLEKLLKEIFKDKRYVLSHLKIVRGSVIVTFSAPLSEANSLDILVREQSLFALKVGVSLLVVADTVITQSESTDFSFETSLLDSAKDNDPTLLSFLLSINTNPDTADKDGQTALMLACVDNQQKSTRLLLKANSNPNIQDSNGISPLYLASREGHTDTVALLLKANANPNLQENDGRTPLYIASRNSHTDTVALLLKANANPNFQRDTCSTPLYIASQNGHTDTVALLLKADANPNLQRDTGSTPLYIASQNGHTDTVALLLKADANPNLQRDTGLTPLLIASQEGHTDTVALLLKADANPNLQKDTGSTPLYIASQNGLIDTVALLLKADANPNLQKDTGSTPLYIASQNGHTDTVALLLKANANPNLQENAVCTPLYIASYNGHTDTVALLLKANANPNLQENDGCTPLYIASENGHTDTVALLLNANANPNLQRNTGSTPLYTANRHGHTDIANLLLNAGADPNYHLKSLELFTVNPKGRSDALTLFQRANPNLYFPRHVGKTSFYSASEIGDTDDIGMFLSDNPDTS